MKSSCPSSLAHVLVASILFAAPACGGDDSGEDDGGDDAPVVEGNYVVGSLVFGPDSTTSYVSVLADIGAQTIDYTKAREFGGLVDVWVHEGAVYTADSASLTITKFTVDGQTLVEGPKVSFAQFGITDFGFWRNTFVGSTKAYFLNGSESFVVWDPSTMTITKEVALPDLEAPADHALFPGYSDRATRIRGGKLYQPLYFTKPDYYQVDPASRVAVYDLATDALVGVLEAPCPGLDFSTEDAQGNLYFSSWVFAAGGAEVLGGADTCVVKVDATDAVTVAFTPAELTEGRQGGAFRYLGNGKALLSVLHGEHAAPAEPRDVAAVTNGANWKYWSYDMTTGAVTALDSLDWNSGGTYSYRIGDRTIILVPAGDYSKTSVFDLGDATAPTPLFETQGWSTRLFAL
jgi:hypothetical protein